MNEIIQARTMAVTEHARILFEREHETERGDADDVQAAYVQWLRGRESRGSMFYALRIIGSVGAAFEAQEDARAAVEAFGEALCAAAALLWRHRLALSPVLTFARELQRDGAEPVRGAGVLARGATAEVDPGAPDIVYGVALALAHAIDSCEIVHALTIDPAGLFVAVAGERMGNGNAARSDGSEPTPPPTDGAEQRRQPAGMPGPEACPPSGVEIMGRIHDGALEAAQREDEQWMRESEGGTKWPMRQPTEPLVGLGDFVPTTPEPDTRPLIAKCRRCKADITPIRARSALCGPCADHARNEWTRMMGERRPDEAVDTPRTRAAMEQLQHASIAFGCLCPTCAAPLSYLRDNLYGCGRHEHQGEHLKALGATEADLDRMRRSSRACTADTSILS